MDTNIVTFIILVICTVAPIICINLGENMCSGDLIRGYKPFLCLFAVVLFLFIITWS